MEGKLIDILLHAIRSIDLGVYQFLNGYAGHRVPDVLAAFEEENNLLKGGLFLSLYAYLWFRNGADGEHRRGVIIATVVGTLLAVVVSRTISDVIPFRVRPMYEPSIAHLPHSFAITGNMERWSSFPSDTAAYFVAMAFGLGRLLKRYRLPLVLYTAVWICLPRLFLGEHYLSDIVAGSLVGVTMVWFSVRSKILQYTLAQRLRAASEAHPGVFYSVALIGAFEMAVMFNDLRSAAHLLLHSSLHLLPLACAVLSLLIAIAYVLARAFGLRGQHPTSRSVTGVRSSTPA